MQVGAITGLSFFAVGAITVFLITFHAEPFDFFGVTLYYPVLEPLNNIAAQITDYMRDTLVPSNVQLIQTAPGQAFFAQVYIAALVSIVCSMPVIVRESVGFLAPALKETEVKISRSVAFPALALFIGGCVFSYVAVIPYILDFLYTYGESAGLVTFLNVMDFVGFVLQFLIAFGLSFQLPMEQSIYRWKRANLDKSEKTPMPRLCRLLRLVGMDPTCVHCPDSSLLA